MSPYIYRFQERFFAAVHVILFDDYFYTLRCMLAKFCSPYLSELKIVFECQLYRIAWSLGCFSGGQTWRRTWYNLV